MRNLLTIFATTLFAIMLCLAQEEVHAGGDVLSNSELEQLVSPIAMYPDALLIQVLIATTYPVDVVEALDWSNSNPGLNGDDAMQIVRNRYWDLSVISLLAFPKVLAMIGGRPEWMRSMGEAFLEKPDAVMEAVQTMRSKAKEANKLEAIEQHELSSTDETITIIESAESRVAYLPPYNSTIVYGTRWAPYYRPRYYGYYRPRYYGYYRPRYYGYYGPRFYNPGFRSWYYPPYGYYGSRW